MISAGGKVSTPLAIIKGLEKEKPVILFKVTIS
jgi:hypothetical protein